VPLVYDPDERARYFAADLPERFFHGSNRYYLSIKVDMPPREILRRLTDTGKVCSREDMAEVRRLNVPTLGLDYLETPPEELPRLAHCSYFALDHRHRLWSRIAERRNLAVFCDVPPEKTEMRLLVIFEP
jgi:predicted component of type VI protein secretion system